MLFNHLPTQSEKQKIQLDYNSEHRDFAFLVLSNQSLGLLYENNDNQKAIYHIQEAIKIAYNTGNVLLLETRFR